MTLTTFELTDDQAARLLRVLRFIEFEGPTWSPLVRDAVEAIEARDALRLRLLYELCDNVDSRCGVRVLEFVDHVLGIDHDDPRFATDLDPWDILYDEANL